MRRALTAVRSMAPWLIAWVLIAATGDALLTRFEFVQLREAFETDARIAHRLLSQRVVQHDAIMSMLMILQPAGDPAQPEQFLPAIYPHILKVQRFAGAAGEAPLDQAIAESRRAKHAVLARVDFAKGQYQMVLGANPASYALTIDLRAMVASTEWPMALQDSPVRVALEYGSQAFALQPGALGAGGWRFAFRKHLAAESQPFELLAERQWLWVELPWWPMVLWALFTAAALAGVRALQKQRQARRRAEELLRFGQVARLNTLGELAAGMAHELNQPLTAVLAGSQAASRLLRDPDCDTSKVQDALQHVAEQARRAADVIARMRRAVERPNLAGPLQTVTLQDVIGNALYLLEPECRRLQVVPVVSSPHGALKVLAEPIALEQVVHNLLNNALQALEQNAPQDRRLQVDIDVERNLAVLRIRDSGKGIALEVLPHIFEPFFTTRKDGLGLGLNLCETLAAGMDGRLAAANHAAGGAVFTLTLRLATNP